VAIMSLKEEKMYWEAQECILEMLGGEDE